MAMLEPRKNPVPIVQPTPMRAATKIKIVLLSMQVQHLSVSMTLACDRLFFIHDQGDILGILSWKGVHVMNGEHVILPKGRLGFRLGKGQCMRVVDVEGQQVADVMAYHEKIFMKNLTKVRRWTVCSRLK